MQPSAPSNPSELRPLLEARQQQAAQYSSEAEQHSRNWDRMNKIAKDALQIPNSKDVQALVDQYRTKA